MAKPLFWMVSFREDHPSEKSAVPSGNDASAIRSVLHRIPFFWYPNDPLENYQQKFQTSSGEDILRGAKG
jgi:hypothetical protein